MKKILQFNLLTMMLKKELFSMKWALNISVRSRIIRGMARVCSIIKMVATMMGIGEIIECMEKVHSLTHKPIYFMKEVGIWTIFMVKVEYSMINLFLYPLLLTITTLFPKI